MKKHVNTIIVVLFIILVPVVFYLGSTDSQKDTQNANNVVLTDGKQIINLAAKGGFSPRSSFAKAGVPTILRVETNGTFDCSSSIRIPDLGVSKVLPQTGVTDIDIGTPKVGVFNGTCGMGMYPFTIDFKS